MLSGRDANATDDWYLENAAGDEFVGVQAYTHNIIGSGVLARQPRHREDLIDWGHFPPAAAIGVRAAWELSQHTPVMVTETGIATATAYDYRRLAYTDGTLADLNKCLDDGITLLGIPALVSLRRLGVGLGLRADLPSDLVGSRDV